MVTTKLATIALSEVIRTQSTFTPAINIAEDLKRLELLHPYELGSRNIHALQRVLSACAEQSRERSFCFVGPYGAGKSTFGLFVAAMLSAQRVQPWIKSAFDHLEDVDPDAFIQARDVLGEGEYVAIVLDPKSSSLARAMADGILEAAQSLGLDGLRKSVRQLLKTHEPEPAGVVAALRTLLSELPHQGRTGAIVLADEFARFLEPSGSRTAVRNMAFAQEVAEIANHSGTSRLLFFLFLHQNLEAYQTGLSRQQRVEWSKIQGRFQLVSFLGNPETQAEIIARSLSHNPSVEPQVVSWADDLWESLRNLECFSGTSRQWREHFAASYPLHPMAAIALPHLATLLGQNERTLFTFLNSEGPHGLKDFLRRHFLGNPLISLGLDWLCDYFLLSHATGAVPYTLHRQLSRISIALERVSDGDGIETRIVKIIGVLGLLAGRSGLWPKKGLLAAALDVRTDEDWAVLEKGLASLIAQKVLISRRYADEYYLWDGSDFDLEDTLEQQIRELAPKFAAGDYLSDLVSLPPVIARRHSFATGAARSFALRFSDFPIESSEGATDWRAVPTHPDGEIIIVVGSDAQAASAEAKQYHAVVPTVLVIPKEPQVLLDLAVETQALRLLLEANEALEADAIAKREVTLRLETVRRGLHAAVLDALNPSADSATCIVEGQTQDFASDRGMQGALSDLCDRAYSSAPAVRNELINRRQLSTSVVVATKKILASLVEDAGLPSLGFEGNGPEVSIFRGLFETSGIYRKSGGRFQLGKPEKASTLRPAWEHVEAFLNSTREGPQPLSKLLMSLSAPPFGLRPGLSPIIVLAVLLHQRQRVCLYERATYLPTWTPELYDRMVRRPEEFEVRYYSRSKTEELIRELHKQFSKDDTPGSGPIGVNGFLQDLFAWYRGLPEYARRTNNVSASAKALRASIASASDPIELLTVQMPNALGIRPGSSSTRTYTQRFGRVVLELERLTPALRREIVRMMSGYARIPCTTKALRAWFAEMAEKDLPALNAVTKAMIVRATDSTLENEQWIESVSSVLVGQAPSRWSPVQFSEFEERLTASFEAIRLAERAQFLRDKDESTRRLTIDSPKGLVLDDLVQIEPQDKRALADASREINATLRDVPSRLRGTALVLALEKLSKQSKRG